MQKLSPILALTAAFLASCATLKSEPYSEFGKGQTVVGASTGWAFYEAKAQAGGLSGVLEGRQGTDTTTLKPNYGGAIKLHHMVTDRIALGGIIELRSFDPDSLQPLDATLTASDFETIHLIASSRYFFDPFGPGRRWRPFAGLDLSYIPDVALGDVEVDYSPSPIPTETINVTGSAYWSIGFVAGAQYLLRDHLTLDMGGFYEYSFTPSEATVAFENLGGAEAKMELFPRGLILFVGLTYSL
jgi:hypothetical protein